MKTVVEKIRSVFADEHPFFYTVPGGLEVFYPWGCPGEAYYIDKKRKNQLSFFGLGIALIASVTLLGAIYLDFSSLLPDIGMYVVSAMCFFVPAIYVLGIYFFVRNKTPYFVSKQNRADKKMSVLHQFIFFQVCAIVVVSTDFVLREDVPADFWKCVVVTGAFVQIAFFCWIIKINKTRKGYFFQP